MKANGGGGGRYSALDIVGLCAADLRKIATMVANVAAALEGLAVAIEAMQDSEAVE